MFFVHAETKGKECYACGNQGHSKHSPHYSARNQFFMAVARDHFRLKCRAMQASRSGQADRPPVVIVPIKVGRQTQT